MRDLVDPFVLSQALNQQRSTGQRLVSMLVSRAQIDADDGTLALAEQHEVPAALQRHLEACDPAAVPLVPWQLARRWVVHPIARSRNGSLVVAARDPSVSLQNALEHAIGTPVVIAVAVAIQIERAVLASYGELEVDDTDLLDTEDVVAANNISTTDPFATTESIELATAALRRTRDISDVLRNMTLELGTSRRR